MLHLCIVRGSVGRLLCLLRWRGVGAGVHVVVFWSWSACALHSCAVPSATVGFVIRYPEFGYCSCNYNGYATR